MNKIQYRFKDGEHKFYGLVGMPEDPKESDYTNHQAPGMNDFIRADSDCQKEVKRIKSNAPEIINASELLNIYTCEVNGKTESFRYFDTCVLLKDNDIFDLPQGLEFEKEYQVSFDEINWHACDEKDFLIYNFQRELTREVLRIVKAETQSNLLPCPFCGSQAEWINETLQDGHYYIRCTNGHCRVTIKADRRDKASGLWNGRVKPKEAEKEPEESQDQLWDQAVMDMFEKGNQYMLNNWILQRKN